MKEKVWSLDFLLKESQLLQADVTANTTLRAELQKKENFALEKQGLITRATLPESGADLGTTMKKIKVLNEVESNKIQVWRVKSHARLQERLQLLSMILYSKEDGDIVDFDDLVAAAPEELENPEFFQYVLRPSILTSSVRFAREMAHNVATTLEASEMAHNVATTLEAHAGRWLERQGLSHYFSHGFYHDAESYYNVHLQSPSWETEENKSGLREKDFFLILDDNPAVLCLGSVKTKITMNHIRELQSDVALLRDLRNVSIKKVSNSDGTSFISIADALPFEPSSLPVVGLAVTAVPNAKLDLKRDDNIIVIESRGDFSLAPLSGVNYDPKGDLPAALRKLAAQQKQPPTAAAPTFATLPRSMRRPGGPNFIGSRTLYSLLRPALK